MYKKILLPTDGSAYADQEVERVKNILAEDGEVIVLSVAGLLTSSAFQSRKKVKKVNDDDDVKVTKMVVRGFPSDAINEVANNEGVDLIVISATGKSGLHRFVLGSVTENVLKNSEVDVLLVHNE